MNMGHTINHLRSLRAALAALLAVAAAPLCAQTITNTARVQWDVGATTIVRDSNRVDIAVGTSATPALSLSTFQFSNEPGSRSLTVPDTICRGTAGDVPVKLDGAFAKTPVNPATVMETTKIRAGEPLVVAISSAQDNRDAAAIDTMTVRLTTPGGDAEIVVLRESGVKHRLFHRFDKNRCGSPPVRARRLSIVAAAWRVARPVERARERCPGRHASRRHSDRSLRHGFRHRRRRAGRRDARHSDQCRHGHACHRVRRRCGVELSQHRDGGHDGQRCQWRDVPFSRRRVSLPVRRPRQIPAAGRTTFALHRTVEDSRRRSGKSGEARRFALFAGQWVLWGCLRSEYAGTRSCRCTARSPRCAAFAAEDRVAGCRRTRRRGAVPNRRQQQRRSAPNGPRHDHRPPARYDAPGTADGALQWYNCSLFGYS